MKTLNDVSGMLAGLHGEVTIVAGEGNATCVTVLKENSDSLVGVKFASLTSIAILSTRSDSLLSRSSLCVRDKLLMTNYRY